MQPRRTSILSRVLAAGILMIAPASIGDEMDIPRVASPQGARVYLISPQAGQTVSSPVVVVFGLSGMGVAPAGVPKQNTGHHHLLIDTELPPLGLPVPADAQHRHFGGGQTEVELELAPGPHTLQLLLADHNHIPHDPPLSSERVQFTVR